MSEQTLSMIEESLVQTTPLVVTEGLGVRGFDAVHFARNGLAFQIYRPELQTGEVRDCYPNFTPTVAATLALRSAGVSLRRMRTILADDMDQAEYVYRTQRWDRPLIAARALRRAFEIGLFKRADTRLHKTQVPDNFSLKALRVVTDASLRNPGPGVPEALDRLAVRLGTDDLPPLLAQAYSSVPPTAIDPRIRHTTDLGISPRPIPVFNKTARYAPGTDPHSHWREALARQEPVYSESRLLPPPEEQGKLVKWGEGIFVDDIPRVGRGDERAQDLRSRILKLSCFDVSNAQVKALMAPEPVSVWNSIAAARRNLQLPEPIQAATDELFNQGMMKVYQRMEAPSIGFTADDRRVLALLMSSGSMEDIAAATGIDRTVLTRRTGVFFRAFGVTTRRGLVTALHGTGLADSALKNYRVNSRWPYHQE